MATSLALPLDDWVAAAARPVQLDVLNASSEPGARRNYSKITPEDAFPLLIQACRTRFGNIDGLDFNVKESPGPLAYSATLTITGPDEIGIEFPHSGYHATRILAKTHAAHRAVQQGAIEFIMQSDGPEPPAPASSSKPISAGAPPPNRALNPVASTSAAPPAPPKPVPAPKSIPTWLGLQTRPPINLINSVLQKAYNSHKVPLSKTSQAWELPNYMTGVAARLTIKLPSGRKQSYGAIPGDNSTSNGQSRLRSYATTRIAKESVAALAIESGVLDWIRSEELPTAPSTRKTLTTVESTRPNGDGPSSSNNQAGPSSRTQVLGHLPAKPSFLPAASAKKAPAQSQKAAAPKKAAGKAQGGRQSLRAEIAELHRENLEAQKSSSTTSPVDEARAVDELLGSPIPSRPASPRPEPESHLRTPEKPAPKETEAEAEDERSVAMDLETDAGSLGRATPVGRRMSVSVEMEAVREEGEVDEPPRKRQRTELPDALSGNSTSPEEVKVMEGESYSKILSDYCLEYGRPQPQITFQRHRTDASDNGPVNYHVSLVVGSARYELSKNYEKVEEAEEKLSKRILKLFGVKAKKGRAGEA